MTQRHIQLYALLQELENETVLAEALHFPEVSRLAENHGKASRAAAQNARGLLERAPLRELYHRLAASPPEVQLFKVELPQPKELPLWHGPLVLTFHAAVYEIPGGAVVANFPVLRMEIVAADREELAARVPGELLLALRRGRAADTLITLAGLQRCTSLTIDASTIKADIATPKEVAIREAGDNRAPSVLAAAALDLNAQTLPVAHEYQDHVQRLQTALSEPQAESVLLVGPSGVGKTAVFHELVRRREELQFGRTPFWATSGSRLVAGMSGFGKWQERCDNLRKEASRTRAILHLGNLVELMEVGKGVMIQQGMAGFLRPFIARGELLCVVECTPEQIPLIERQDPHLLGVFRRIDIAEPEQARATSILLSAASEISESKGRELLDLPALETIDRLHRRYATYSAYPGRPLRFLRNLLADREQPAELSDVYAAFSRETGLPRMMLDASIAMDTAATRDWFSERIIGQNSALDHVVDMLATVKAGLSRPRKPLASFLFVGPTGVGKTETAKALAEFLFNDRKRVTRFDMSEFATPGAVQRLIGGVFGEEGLLTARMREQPFAVLLFDEFEKAHPLFFDLLLQVLGEARLTDAAGRLADFGNAVIIMTSNLGAEGFMRGGIGFGQSQPDAEAHFTKALQDFTRPELLNRIDRVVPFTPLDESAVLAILDRELEALSRRPGIESTGARLEVTQAARRLLAGKAFEPSLGARPLKRELESTLAVPLAQLLNTQPLTYALHVVVDADQDELRFNATPLDQAVPARGYQAPALLTDTTNLRRRLQRALTSTAATRLRNEIYRLGRSVEMEKRRRRKRGDNPQSWQALVSEKRLATVRVVLGQFESALANTADLEDRLSLAGLGHGAQAATVGEFQDCERAWAAALLALMRLDGGGVDAANLWIYSHHNELMFDLARAYYAWAHGAGFSIGVYWAKPNLSDAEYREVSLRAGSDAAAREAVRRYVQNRNGDKAPNTELFPPAVAEVFLETPPEDTGALILRVTGQDAGLMLGLEQGLHRFKQDSDSEPVDVEVRVIGGDVWTVALPTPRGMVSEGEVRRRYDLAQRQALDAVLSEIVAWTGGSIDGVLARCIRQSFMSHLDRQVIE